MNMKDIHTVSGKTGLFCLCVGSTVFGNFSTDGRRAKMAALFNFLQSALRSFRAAAFGRFNRGSALKGRGLPFCAVFAPPLTI